MRNTLTFLIAIKKLIAKKSEMRFILLSYSENGCHTTTHAYNSDITACCLLFVKREEHRSDFLTAFSILLCYSVPQTCVSCPGEINHD